MKVLSSILLLFIIQSVYAQHDNWDGTPSGHIGHIELSEQVFIVSLESDIPLCGDDSPTWSMLSINENHYPIFVNMLLQAKAAEQTVTLYTSLLDGHCYIKRIKTE